MLCQQLFEAVNKLIGLEPHVVQVAFSLKLGILAALVMLFEPFIDVFDGRQDLLQVILVLLCRNIAAIITAPVLVTVANLFRVPFDDRRAAWIALPCKILNAVFLQVTKFALRIFATLYNRELFADQLQANSPELQIRLRV